MPQVLEQPTVDEARRSAKSLMRTCVLLGERSSLLALAVLIVLVFILYYAVLTPRSFGYYNDDAIYLSTAKALATGRGYRLIDLPYEPAQTKYPPLFPFLLSVVWRVRPDFPANLASMFMVARSASILAVIVTWRYLSRCRYATRWGALLIVGLAAINLNTVQFSVGVFSEMVYTLFAVMALLLAERYAESEGSTALALMLGLAMACAFLTRIAGITLPIAVGLYFLLNRRLKRALVPLAISGAAVLAWSIWTHHNRTSFNEPNAIFHTDYLRYAYELVRDAHIANHRPLVVETARMLVKNLREFAGYWIPSETCGSYTDWLPTTPTGLQHVILRCVWLGGLLYMGIGLRRDRWRLLPIYLLLYIGLHVTLPYHTYDRYLAPILAFSILYMTKGLWEVNKLAWWRRASASSTSPASTGSARIWAVLRFIGRGFGRGLTMVPVLAITAFGLVSYAAGLSNTLKHQKADAIERSYEDAPAFDWIETNTPATAVIATVQHPMYYMYTGRKATLCFATEGPPSPRQSWQIKQLLQIIKTNKVDYLVLADSDFASQPGDVDYTSVTEKLIDSGDISLAFESPGEKVLIYRCNREDRAIRNAMPQS
ncbi:MAG TPA: glycosyltransferase family 39 protein, partial [Blastocatellia bacterium]|nr:glycosyltransferase family 39 protein [Blastocatellia bacterium]